MKLCQCFIAVQIKNFRSGSFIFDFKVYTNATASVSDDSLKYVIEKGEGSSNFNITGVKFAGPKPTTSSTEKPESAGLDKWINVMIVTGVVIVILAILLGVVVVSY